MNNKNNSELGFSIVELVVVLAVITVLSVIALMSFTTEKLYQADTQAINLVDIFQEARQRSLAQRTTMRVEINQTDRVIEIIDEGRLGDDTSDDVVIKTSQFVGTGDVFVGSVPDNQNSNPAELSPTPIVAFQNSVHPHSSGDSVVTLRFTRSGTVENAGDDALGTNAVPTGATIFVWSKYPEDNSANPTTGQMFRAVTVLASSGLTRMWKCGNENGSCNTWQSSNSQYYNPPSY